MKQKRFSKKNVLEYLKERELKYRRIVERDRGPNNFACGILMQIRHAQLTLGNLK